MAFHYKGYEAWKGELISSGWQVCNNVLWNVSTWSTGWTDWRTPSKVFVCASFVSKHFLGNNIVVQLLKCMWQDTYGAPGAHHGTHDLHGEEAVHPEPRTCHA